MNQSRVPYKATLLLGPTSAGKTPLGDIIQLRGLWGADYLHFDFGENLRDIVARDEPDEVVSRADIDLLRHMLETGALLEDEHFPLARRILLSFIKRHRAGQKHRILLNGLPRHVGQATAIEATLDVKNVVQLRCSAETVLKRIMADPGGDRANRVDDHIEAVGRKLAIFEERTAPLVEYYASRGAKIRAIDVTAEMTAEQTWAALEAR